MKKVIIIVIIAVFTISVFGQTENDILKASEQLIENKQYLSAFQKLDSFDSENLKPKIVLQKEKIVLNYFVSSMMHQMFALKNLKENETVMDYRGQEGSFSMVSFPVNEIIDTLISIYPNNYELYNGLAEFYYEVHLKYGDNWLKSTSELFKLIEENYTISIKNNTSDFLSYYVMGYLKISNQQIKESIEYFKKSIILQNDYPSSHYNLAYAYLYINERDSAITEAKISIEQYRDSIYKADAYRMVGVIYTELNDTINAIKYMELGNLEDPNNYYTLKPLLNLYVASNNSNQKKTTEEFFQLAPANPTIYNDLAEIYDNANKFNSLEEFYKSKLNEYKNENKVLGNLYFYLGQMQMETNNKNKAIVNLNKAKDVFSNVYPEDHQVFSVINEILKNNE